MEGLSGPIADDAAFRQTWRTILPIYFKRYSAEIGDAMDESTSYSAAAFNRGFFECLSRFNTVNRLAETTTPALVIAGRDDWMMPPSEGAERLHSRLPNSQLVVFEESGHFPFIEEQDAFLATVAEWLATNVSRQ